MNKSPLYVLILPLIMAGTTVIHAELQDPTQPPPNFIQDKGSLSSAFELNAIVTSSDRRFAIINGLEKKIGDTLLGKQITSIQNNTVRLEGPGGRIILFLLGKPIKTWNEAVCMDANEPQRCY